MFLVSSDEPLMHVITASQLMAAAATDVAGVNAVGYPIAANTALLRLAGGWELIAW